MIPKVKQTKLFLTKEQLEALRLALGDWIETNEKCILDNMKNAPRAEKLDQINYHVMLSSLYKDICEKEEFLEHMNGRSNVIVVD